MARPENFIHGKANTRIHWLWESMKQRCYNPRDKSYPRYGGRGIYVCERWRNSFHNFYLDMGDRPEGMTLERKDNNGPYSPENCRWATDFIQNRNKRNNRKFTYNGESLIAADWAKRIGVAEACMRYRLLHWPIERALSTVVIIPAERKGEK